jgi:hypothetical protein
MNPQRMSKRKFVVYASTFASSLGLQACGGGSDSSETDVPPNGDFLLPNGMTAKDATIYGRGGRQISVDTPGNVAGSGGELDLMMVTHSASGRLLMPCMVQAVSTNNTLDALNVAATLLFIALGGSGALKFQRAGIWQALRLDPATQALANAITKAWSSNPYAIADQAESIAAQLDLSVAALLPATIAAFKAPQLVTGNGAGTANGSVQVRAAALSAKNIQREAGSAQKASLVVSVSPSFAPPSPGVSIKISGTPYVKGERVDDYYVELGSYTYLEPAYVYDVGRVTSDGAAVLKDSATLLFGPNSLKQGEAGPVQTMDLVAPGDKYRLLTRVILSPRFDMDVPAAHPFWDRLSAFKPEWQTKQKLLYRHGAIILAQSLLLEALGQPVGEFSMQGIEADSEALKLINPMVAAAILEAENGINLFGTVNKIVDAVRADDASLDKLIDVLARYAPIANGDVTKATLKQFIGIYKWFNPRDRNRELGYYGQFMTSLPLDVLLLPVFEYFAPDVVAKNRVKYYANRLWVAPAEVDITGEIYEGYTKSSVRKLTVRHELSQIPNLPEWNSFFGDPEARDNLARLEFAADTKVRSYRWKVEGAGNCELRSATGQQGRSIETTAADVSFIADETATGPQIIRVDVFNLEYGAPLRYASASETLQSGVLLFEPQDPWVEKDSVTKLTVRLDGAPFPAGALYEWRLGGITALGRGEPTAALNGSSRNYSSFTTTTPSVVFTAPSVPSLTDVSVALVMKANGDALFRGSTQVIVPLKLSLNPGSATVAPGSTKIFTASAEGEDFIKSSLTFDWVANKGTVLGGSQFSSVPAPGGRIQQATYTAPAEGGSDTITLKVSLDGQTVGTASAPILIGSGEGKVRLTDYVTRVLVVPAEYGGGWQLRAFYTFRPDLSQVIDYKVELSENAGSEAGRPFVSATAPHTELIKARPALVDNTSFLDAFRSAYGAVGIYNLGDGLVGFSDQRFELPLRNLGDNLTFQRKSLAVNLSIYRVDLTTTPR